MKNVEILCDSHKFLQSKARWAILNSVLGAHAPHSHEMSSIWIAPPLSVASMPLIHSSICAIRSILQGLLFCAKNRALYPFLRFQGLYQYLVVPLISVLAKPRRTHV